MIAFADANGACKKAKAMFVESSIVIGAAIGMDKAGEYDVVVLVWRDPPVGMVPSEIDGVPLVIRKILRRD